MDKYNIYCTEEQTMKALELGAPIEEDCRYNKDIMFEEECVICERQLVPPTAEQLIGWLEEQISYIDVIKQEDNTWLYIIYFKNNSNRNITVKGFSSRPEATLAAIDAALEYLRKGGKE